MGIGYFRTQTKLDFKWPPPNEVSVAISSPIPWTGIGHFEDVDLDVFGEIDFERGQVKCGGSAQGNEGFVARENEFGELLWIAFFQDSNPFMSVTLEGQDAVATSEYGDEWIFPLDAPQLLHFRHSV